MLNHNRYATITTITTCCLVGFYLNVSILNHIPILSLKVYLNEELKGMSTYKVFNHVLFKLHQNHASVGGSWKSTTVYIESNRWKQSMYVFMNECSNAAGLEPHKDIPPFRTTRCRTRLCVCFAERATPLQHMLSDLGWVGKVFNHFVHTF